MEIDWIDLPDDNYVVILGYETAHTLALSQKVKAYHSLKKSSEKNLTLRIDYLEEIISFINHWIEHDLSMIDKKKHLNWIADIATKKRNYLTALSEIYSLNKHSDEAQIAYHTNIDLLKDSKLKVVTLTNHRFFSLKMREFWGDFWLESLDPCHRRLTPFLEQWQKLDSPPHFFLWLEEQHIPKYVPKVTYLQGDALENTKIHIQNGLLCHRDQNPINVPDSKKRFLFSIDLDKKIYGAKEENGISHSSFTSGRPVLGAGLLWVNKGYLKGIALESGHYMPTIEIGYQIIQLFQELGIAFPETLELTFFYDRNKYTTYLLEKDLQDFLSFKIALEQTYSSKLTASYTQQRH